MTALSEAGWARLLLTDMGVPTSANNVGNIERWMTAEHPTDDWYGRNNPLNSSYLTGGPGDGTGGYSSLQDAANADAAQITEAGTTATGVDTGNKYTAIYNALQSNASTADFASAVEASPWAGSHYAGDPIDKIPVPSGTVTAPNSTGDDTGTLGAGTGTTTGTTGSSSLPGFSILHPEKSIAAIGMELLAVAAGLGLVILGAVKTASPGTKISSKVAGAGRDAGEAAVLA